MENIAATWRYGSAGSIVSDEPGPGNDPALDAGVEKFYGGKYLIAESMPPETAELIIAAVRAYSQSEPVAQTWECARCKARWPQNALPGAIGFESGETVCAPCVVKQYGEEKNAAWDTIRDLRDALSFIVHKRLAILAGLYSFIQAGGHLEGWTIPEMRAWFARGGQMVAETTRYPKAPAAQEKING